MLELNTPHLDDFTLLRYVAEDLDDREKSAAAAHLRACEACRTTIGEIEELDQELRTIANNPETRRDLQIADLPEGDIFRRRPRSIAKKSRAVVGGSFASQAVAASEEGIALSEAVLQAAESSARELEAVLSRLDLADPAQRYALLYSLQEAGRQITRGPARYLGLAERTIDLACEPSRAETGDVDGDGSVPVVAILGQAYQLAAQASLWIGQLDRAEECVNLAYRFFGAVGDEFALAATELLEAQRRSFANQGAEALILVRRARLTFLAVQAEDYVARSWVVEGLALVSLDRREDALEVYRLAVPVFERWGLWSNYVGAVNCIGTSLARLGRLNEARKEYARGLRQLSRENHPAWIGSLRYSLAEVLFLAERFREAAISLNQARRVFADAGLIGNSLRASLLEIESWARHGEIGRALQRLEVFHAEITRLGVLDSSISEEIQRALSGANPDYERITTLRTRAVAVLDDRVRGLIA
jgi:tetratricopeptide (TPR) repeat protein